MWLNPVNREENPAFVLAPQCPKEDYWANVGRPKSFVPGELPEVQEPTRIFRTLKELLEQSDEFVAILTKQIEDSRLDHAALRRVLPSAAMQLTAGQANPVSYFMKTKDLTFNDFILRFGSTPTRGINGRTAVHGLRVDSLQLDTIFFTVKQDTSRMMLQSGVINGPKNPQFVFRSTLTGEIRSADAELTVNYVDGEGQTGVLFGVNARPLTGGGGKGGGRGGGGRGGCFSSHIPDHYMQQSSYLK